jgi:hypothetical protein
MDDRLGVQTLRKIVERLFPDKSTTAERYYGR